MNLCLNHKVPNKKLSLKLLYINKEHQQDQLEMYLINLILGI